MSKALAWVEGLYTDEAGEVFFDVRYRLSPPAPNGHADGQILIAFDGYTETELNALIQQSVADKANNESSQTLTLTVNDVRGGRI